MNNLVIVESPTKARTLQKFLGDKYQIEASMGHVRDLPKSEFGVDIEHNFEPQYIIPRDKKKRVNELKKAAKGVQTLWLATDPDREGEAIAWHLAQLLSDYRLPTTAKSGLATAEDGRQKTEVKRVVFHEITKEAIQEAFENPRQIDMKLVDAQQARRVLDRLVGYKLSPLLWQKVKKGLSAGRVQSVALRLIVEREKEVLAFKPEEYWIIEAELSAAGPVGSVSRRASSLDSSLRLRAGTPSSPSPADVFVATLIEKDGKKLEIKNKEEADTHVKNLGKSEYKIAKITKKEVRRYPYPPFTTSTLQQTAANKLGMSAKKTMVLAQALYEHGFITYMRTDSVNLSTGAVSIVREYIKDFIGKSYLSSSPRLYKSKSKNAQEAHEAIRVTDVSRQSSAIRQISGMNKDHLRLYDLIWKRFVACQMSEAVMDQTTIDVEATTDYRLPTTAKSGLATAEDGRQKTGSYLLRVTGSVIKFEGWLKLYDRVKESEESEESKEQKLPELQEAEPLSLIQLLPTQHFTQPPSRYNDASLIKKLEELEIGRPSTYAPILSTIIERFYVEKLERKFIPTSLGITVCEFLVEYFPDVFDYSFTAQMEHELDEIASGERQWRPTIKTFFDPFAKKLEETEKTAEKVKLEVELAGKLCPKCGKDLIIRIGRFGKFFACSGFPECKHTESMEEKVNAICPQDGGEILSRRTRRGKTFYGCKNWPTCKFASWTKPKSATINTQ